MVFGAEHCSSCSAPIAWVDVAALVSVPLLAAALQGQLADWRTVTASVHMERGAACSCPACGLRHSNRSDCLAHMRAAHADLLACTLALQSLEGSDATPASKRAASPRKKAAVATATVWSKGVGYSGTSNDQLLSNNSRVHQAISAEQAQHAKIRGCFDSLKDALSMQHAEKPTLSSTCLLLALVSSSPILDVLLTVRFCCRCCRASLHSPILCSILAQHLRNNSLMLILAEHADLYNSLLGFLLVLLQHPIGLSVLHPASAVGAYFQPPFLLKTKSVSHSRNCSFSNCFKRKMRPRPLLLCRLRANAKQMPSWPVRPSARQAAHPQLPHSCASSLKTCIASVVFDCKRVFFV